MKNIIESLGVTTVEFIGAAVVLGALYGAIVLLRNFGDLFISHFM